MELPKYIQKKIEQQNKAVYKADLLRREIDSWCQKQGIDIYGDDYGEAMAPIEDAVGSLDAGIIKRILEQKEEKQHGR